MKKKFMAALLTVAVVAAVFSGCGSSSGSSASTDTSSDEKVEEAVAEADTAVEAAGEQTDAGDPKYGGVVRIGTHLVTPAPGYTPENTTNASLMYLNIAYESMIEYGADGSLQPRLATSWETDPEEPSITWTLREGVQFADGTDFNAEAVKRNIEEYQSCNRNETANVASCEIIDDHTIKMVLDHWDSSTLESVGWFVYYMSPDALEDVDSLRTASCGTGPFQVSDFNINVSVKYTKNENYWQEGKPYLDGVEVYIVEETTTRATAFEAGEYDIVRMNDLTLSQDINAIGENNFGKIIMEQNQTGQGLIMTGLIPNSADENSPFADSRVRLAMACAIDVDSLIDAFGYGMLTSTDQWAAPTAVTYNTELNAVHYDPEHAKELLAEAGYPDGFDTVLTTNPGNSDIFTAAANMLDEVGIRCRVDLVDESAQVNLYSTGTWEGIMGHYASIAPDLGLYMGRHLDTTGAFYAKGIQHPDEEMTLLQEIRTAATDEEKIDYEHQMQAQLYDFETGSALFGRPLFIQNEPVFKYDYVVDDHMSVYNFSSWTPADCWINK